MMSHKKLLAFLAAGVSLVVLDSGAASAAADKTFSPASNWVVNRVDPPNGGSAYCTLARRFDGNMIVTFARNTEGEGTVAIDFQQPLFQSSQTYRIALQAGYGLKREFLTRPATANALVLRTGQDPQFFSALTGSSEMTVIFDNGRYGFSMPDFGAGEQKLSGCIGDSPAVMPRTPAADTDTAALSQLRREIDALKQENASIAASLKQDGSTSSPVVGGMSNSAENEALLSKLAALENEKNALVDRLQTERTRQQQEAQDEEALKQALEDQKALRLMLDTERQQRSELESALTEKTAEAEKRGELKARIEQLESSNAQLKTLRETLDAERSKRLMAEKMLQEQKAKSAATLEDQERLRTRVTELENENASLQQTASQFESAKIQLQTTESKVSEEQARREAAERALKEVQMTASQKEARIATLQSQMEEERRKLEDADMRKQAALSQKHTEELARMSAEIEKLRSVDSEKEQRLAQLQARMEVERARLEEAEVQKQAALSKKHSEELARLNIEIENLRRSNLQKEEISQNFTAEQARRAATEKELNAMRAALSEKETKIVKLDAEKALLMEQFEKERAEFAKVRTAQSSEDSRLKEMVVKLTELESRNTSLMTEVQTAKARTQEMEKMAAQMKSEGESSKKISQINTQDELDRRELKAMLEAERARREKLEAIAARGGSTDDSLREIESQMGELAKRNSELEKALAEEKTKTDSVLADRTEQLKKQLDVMKADNAMLAEKLARNASPSASEDAKVVEKVVEKVVYQGDDQMAEVLAEVKSSLASVAAERDEYRNLLQRERIEKGAAESTSGSEKSSGVNAQIAALETERVDLIRQLEYERSRNEQIAAGREAPPPSGKSEKDIDKRLKALEDEKSKLKKQLDIAQKDVLDARQASGDAAPSVPDADVAALLAENKKLQAELAASARSGKTQDVRALETEIAALRAQNSVLSQEINKRMAAAPVTAAADNAVAAADYRARATESEAKKMEMRYAAVEAENMRLAQELARAKNVPVQAPEVQVVEKVVEVESKVDSNRMAGMEAENLRLAQELAKARMQPIVEPQQMQQAAATPPEAPAMENQPAQPAMQAASVSRPAPEVAQAPAAPAAPVQQASYKSVPAPASQPSRMLMPASIPAEMGPSGRDIENYLRRAGINMVSGMEKVRKVSNQQFAAFRWDTGVVFGTAEQRTMANRNSFEQAINAYLEKTKERCSGTFDQSFDPSQMSGRKALAVADVACVMPDGQGAGAAVVFFYKDGLFSAVAHEGEIGQFDQAMNTRDALARLLAGAI
ncbi:MAG: hypothetical protein EBQ96_09035 [Proteobacteria bacterium]|nr:hypothetical protein [Pseudomonadota bacterium]